MTQPNVSPNKAFIEAALGMVEVVADTVVGYRKRLVDGGVPEAVADDMSREFHALIIEQMRNSQVNVKGRR